MPLMQALRLKFDNNKTIELCGAWRYRTDKSILLGSMDIGFFLGVGEEEVDQFLKEQNRQHSKRLKSLIGKRLKQVSFR